MQKSDFIRHTRLNAEVLEAWIEAGWIAPRQAADTTHFSEIDLARAALIHDLIHEMGVNEEGIAVILDLIDQLHGVRFALRKILSAVSAQPESARRRIMAHTREGAGRTGRSR